jgi:hypothetical protein
MEFSSLLKNPCHFFLRCSSLQSYIKRQDVNVTCVAPTRDRTPFFVTKLIGYFFALLLFGDAVAFKH